MNRLEIRLLGSPTISVASAAVSTDRRKAIALLAYLAVTGTAHARDYLSTLFWPEYDTAAAYLRRTLWELREMVGAEWLDAGRDRIALAHGPDLWVDVREFRRLAGRQDAGHHELPPIDAWAEAASLYQGAFLQGFSLRDSPGFDDWQRFEAEALQREADGLLRRMAAAALAKGSLEGALEPTRRRLTLDPLQEDAHRDLMRLYAQAGNRAAALRQYEQAAHLLKQELNAPPEPATTALYEQIRAGEWSPVAAAPVAVAPVAVPPVVGTTPAVAGAAAAGAETPRRETNPAAEEPGVAPAPKPLHNLPAGASRFVGRRRELDEIGHLLVNEEAKLVALVGPGGVGKTRLALQVAGEQVARHADGVWFVPLAPLSSPEQVVPAVAQALGVQLGDSSSGPIEQLLAWLRGRRLLLLLDNLEHLGDGGMQVAARLAGAPGVQVLATSRVRLNVDGEHVYPVLGLEAARLGGEAQGATGSPAADEDDALALFVQRARSVRPGFQLDAGNQAAVSAICRLVQGFPLGIELAASWIELLAPAEIAVEIEKNLDFLEADGQDERRRSIRAVFDSTWRLLTPGEQEAFARLSILRGRFSR
ncbi:MAG: AfsR/SARP family transcriptional regulator, partial [Caldilineaceae bacterium]